MISLFRMVMRRGGARGMDPLQVSMTGVRMGERFLQVGCHDRALLSGLAAKVGLSGTAAVAAFDSEQVKLAEKVGQQIGALIDIKKTDDHALPFDSDHFDMVVVDDTNGAFGRIDEASRVACLRDAKRAVRQGGRIEVIEGIAATRGAGYDVLSNLTTAGFKPVRVLAEKDGFRFLEGLRTS